MDIFVPEDYPDRLLWSNERVLQRAPSASGRNRLHRIWKKFCWIKFLLQYDVIYSFGKIVTISNISGVPIDLLMVLFRICGTSLVNSPSGCLDEAPKSFWGARDNGTICGNCAFFSNCHESDSLLNIEIANRHQIKIAGTWSNPMRYMDHVQHFKARSFNLEVYKPTIEVPKHLVWRDDLKINIIHSFMSNGRGSSARNIKGSHYLISSISHLRSSGRQINLLNPTDIRSSDMRFLQVQADIAVDQLIYGWWGSTTLECLALGVPVICYLSHDFLKFFHERFPDLEIPVINANPKNIESVLRDLVDDPKRRADLQIKSRSFAEEFLDADSNVIELLRFFKK